MITLSHGITGGDFDSAGMATRRLKEQLARIGVEASALRRAMIASYEAEMNVVIHARTGTLWARLDAGKLDLEIADEGPGIPDMELALREGWSTASEKARQMGFGAGMGLPNIRRNSDLFEIETRVGKGTRIRSTILLRPGAETPSDAPRKTFATPSMETGRCRGCRRCIFACPTSALRMPEDGPTLRDELCVGCASCIEECPDRACSGIRDGGSGALAAIPRDAILVVPRGFVSGFPGGQPPARILRALREMGFSDVRFLEDWEVALRADVRREQQRQDLPLPRIPPFCPPLVGLVESRFPSLIPHLAPYLSPCEAACGEFPLRPVVLAAACPGQYGACAGSSVTERLTVVSPGRLAAAVHSRLGAGGGEEPPPCPGPGEHVHGTGELCVSGARQVLHVLSLAEAGALRGVSILEMHLCAGGCTASPLITVDPQLAAHRWNAFALKGTGAQPGSLAQVGAVSRPRPYSQRPGIRLDPDMGRAMRKLSLIDQRIRSLPGRDCGSCGAPSCAAFAEDVVLDRAPLSSCPYMEKNR